MAPRRRRPKRLDAEPVLHDVSASAGAGGVILPARERRAGAGTPLPGATAPGLTDERGVIADPEAASDRAADPETLRRAREIAARLSLPRPRREAAPRRGAGELVSVPYRGGADEIDIERTLEALIEHPLPGDEQIVVRERIRTRRAVALLVDVSGSMRGERIRTAAATVGALAAELARDDLAVVAFWSDAVVLAHLGDRRAPRALLEGMLRIRARGLTNVEFPLRVAARELGRARARDARAVLLSDCVHNAGPDPRRSAAALARLDVVLDTTGEHDAQLARELARLGRGRLAVARTHRDVAPAISRLFAR